MAGVCVRVGLPLGLGRDPVRDRMVLGEFSLLSPQPFCFDW